MNIKTSVLLILLISFGLVSCYAIWQVGYLGIWTAGLSNWGSAQVLCDLIVVSLLAMMWMVQDARGRGLNAWPYVIVTLVAGSCGPSLYLLRRGGVVA